ncbi:MAG: SCO family protein [Elusimicrobia bacterium]|nr:SCO family protein [Elusimicrobiota bacterium]
MLLSVIFFIVLSFAGGCGRDPSGAAQTRLRKAFQRLGGAPSAGPRLPDFQLTAVAGEKTAPLSRAVLLGRPWAANFIYTRCAGPCPMLSARMASLQARLPKSVALISFTVDPDHDSPEILAGYARRFRADPKRWRFVTGKKSALLNLFRDGFHIAVAESASAPIGDNIAHSTKFVLVDAEGRLRGYYDGDDPASLDRLVSDASSL